MVRPFSEIQKRIEQGKAVVMTSQEVCDLVDSKKKEKLLEVDVVTTATRAVMSGTYAVLSVPFSRPGSFFRAKKAWINGVSAYVGPCPNENLGVLDLIVFGTAQSRDSPDYGGGHLFRDLAERRPALVEIVTDNDRSLQAELSLDQMPFARLMGTRQAFKNYSAFINPGERPVSTIFHAREFDPCSSGATFSGCGQVNPVKNDPLLETIGVGTRVLFNGAEGFVTGTGTRSSPKKPNLAGFADMSGMDPEYMGGFLTSAGPECICSWAVPVPVTSKTILNEIARLDRQICLPIMDVLTRQLLGETHYGDVWENVDLRVEFDPQKCSSCRRCLIERICPMKAVRFHGQGAERDESLCFHCGLCATECPQGAFKANLGAIRLGKRRIPVVLRQSDKLRALRLAEDLKKRILDGSFKMASPVQGIS